MKYKVEFTRRQIEVVNSALAMYQAEAEGGGFDFMTPAEERGALVAADNARRVLWEQTPVGQWVGRSSS